MTNTMQAVVAHGPGDYRLERLPIPEPGEGEILLKVEACGICAGDAKAWAGAPRFWGGEGQPAYVEPPCIPGHEFVGRVVALGHGVSGFKEGDRVTSEQIVPCHECIYCKTNRYWLCESHDVYGFKNYLNGGMAEYMVLPKKALNHRVPDTLPLKQALLIEPFSCSRHCVDRAQIEPEDVVVLSGVGTLGLGMVGAIVKKKPRLLVVLDLKNERLDMAKRFGADRGINPSRSDAVSEVLALTEGYGCDVYIEATGHPESVNQGLEMIRRQGRFVEFSVFQEPATVDWSIIGDGKELTILGSSLSPGCYPKVIQDMERGSLPTDGVVTDLLPMSEWKRAFEMAASGCGSIKVALKPD